MINGQGSVVQRRQHVLADIVDIRHLVVEALHDVLDMCGIEFHKLAFHNLDRLLLSTDPYRLFIAADHIDQCFDDFIYASEIVRIFLDEALIAEFLFEILEIFSSCSHRIRSISLFSCRRFNAVGCAG